MASAAVQISTRRLRLFAFSIKEYCMGLGLQISPIRKETVARVIKINLIYHRQSLLFYLLTGWITEGMYSI